MDLIANNQREPIEGCTGKLCVIPGVLDRIVRRVAHVDPDPVDLVPDHDTVDGLAAAHETTFAKAIKQHSMENIWTS